MTIHACEERQNIIMHQVVPESFSSDVLSFGTEVEAVRGKVGQIRRSITLQETKDNNRYATIGHKVLQTVFVSYYVIFLYSTSFMLMQGLLGS